MSVDWTNTKEAISDLESKLKCFVCGQLPVDPQLLWCKHSFCASCIEDAQRCPKCKFPVSPQEMAPDIMLNKLLRAMRVASEVSKCSKERKIDKEILSNDESANYFQVPHTNKRVLEKAINSTKSRRGSCEVKDTITDCKRNDLEKNGEIETKSLRRSSRSERRGVSPQRSSRSNSRGESPRRNSRDSSRDDSPRRNSRSNSRSGPPLKGKLKRDNTRSPPPKENQDAKLTKTKQQSTSPKTSAKKLNVPSTPKPKPTSKSAPILFSAKKVHNPNKVNSRGETPLQIACRQGKLSVVQQLLKDGAQPNVKDYASWTPLCDAVGSGNVDVVRTLLESGAGVNTPANLNTTALVEAVIRRDHAMVRLLLSYGADMHQRTTLNNTPISLADDETRTLMLSCPHVGAPPPPRVHTTPRSVLAAAKLTQTQLDQVMELCCKFNITLSTIFTEDITHVVVEKSASNTCEASTAVMLAILNGCSVVGMDWVAACVKADALVESDDFEPSGTTDYPASDCFHKSRLNKEQLLPRLFDGCHMSLQHDQAWPPQVKADVVSLVTAGGAVYQPRQCDPERVPDGEVTVMYHTAPASPLGAVSHVILYQPAPAVEPLLKYNMTHAKSLSTSWLYKCIQTFTVTLD